MFCHWYPLSEAPRHLSGRRGMFQIRIKKGLLDYPSGKSAMVYYGAGDDMGQSLITLKIDSVEDYVCRHSESDDVDPHSQLQEYVQRFRTRFGRAPSWPGDLRQADSLL